MKTNVKKAKKWYKGVGKTSKHTNQLPSNIKLVEGAENLYQGSEILKAGYEYKCGLNQVKGHEDAPVEMVVFQKEDEMLVFIEAGNFQYIFAAYMVVDRTRCEHRVAVGQRCRKCGGTAIFKED